MKRREPIQDPSYKPAYKLKERNIISDPYYKPTYKMKEQKVVSDPVFKPAYKLRALTSEPKSIGKSIVQSFISIFTPSKIEKPKPLANIVDVSYTDVFLPSVGGKTRPLPESNAKALDKAVVITPRPIPKSIVAKSIVVMPTVIEEPVPGSRTWKKKQFMSSNFI